MSEHIIGKRLGGLWGRKVLPGVCFCWVHEKNLLELRRNGTRVCTWLTHLISSLNERSQEDSRTSFPAVQQGNIHVQICKFLTEGGQVFILQHHFLSTFSSHFEQNFVKQPQCSYISYPKPKSCPNWSTIMWYFDGQLSIVATKFHFTELKQKRVWMEVFALGNRLAL